MSEVVDRAQPADAAGQRRRAAWLWWSRLTDERYGDRGALARLRRCYAPIEAWAEPETMQLYRALGFEARHRTWRAEAVGVLAIVLAGVGENRPGALGQALGEGERPVLHDLRLRRLTSARDGVELLRGFREAVSLLGGKAPVGDLATCILGWLDADARDRTRTRFLFDYYGAGYAAPSPSHSSETDHTEQMS